MPKFLWSILLLAALFWSAFAYVLVNISPINVSHILLFLFLLFFAFSFSLSVFGFFIYRRRSRAAYIDARKIWRRVYVWSSYVSFGVIGFFALRAFDIFTLLNGGLFLLLYISIFFYIKNN